MPRTEMLLDTYSPFFAELKDYVHLVRELNTVLPEIFNVDGKERSIRLTDINYDMPADTRDYARQLQAKLTDSDYSMPIRGTFKVLDSQGKVIDTMKNKLLLRLPLPTGRATFILRGNEMVLTKQQRLRPGVYTTKGVGGVQAFINSQTRQNMKIRLDPGKLSFSFEIGGKKLPLYPILKAMGVSDKKLLRMWGKDIYQKNYRSDRHTQRVIDKLYDTMLRFTGTAKGPHERADQVKQAFQGTEIDPWTSKLTLGRSFDKITPDVLTEATKKMIGVSSGEVKPDKTDALYFQDAYGFDDLILYGLNQKKKSIRWKLENRLNRPKYTHIDALARPLADVRDLIYKKFTQADLTRNPEQINPIGMFADASEITQMGEGAIGSTFSITHGMRSLDDSSMGFIDPVHTPASDKVGVNTHLALNTIKDGRKLKTALFDMRRNMVNPTKVTISSQDAFDKYVAIPGEFKKDESGKFLPTHRKVRVVHRGGIKKVEPARVDFYLGSPTNIMDIDTALIPFLSSNTPTRTSMALKQITHTLPLENREAPLVQSGTEGISTEHHMYNLMNRRVPSYIKRGKITAVEDDFVRIKDSDGKLFKISIYNKFPLNGHVELNETPFVNVGDKIKAGDVIAENNFSKNGAIALGANMRMVYMPYKGLNWKDALVISESAAEKMAAVRVDNISHDVQKHDILSKKTFRTQYPMAYTGAQMDGLDDDGVVIEGSIVRRGDPLILKMKPRKLTEDDILRGNVSKALSDQLTRDEKEWDSEHDGVVERVVKTPRGIKVYVKSIRPVRRGDKMCLTPDHDYLTDRGWVPVAELKSEDKVCTRNPISGLIEYQYPDEIYSFDHSGEMYLIQSQQIDLCTTLEHKMYVRKRGRKEFGLFPAHSIVGKRISYKKDGIWLAPDVEKFKLPEVKGRTHNGHPRQLPAVSMDDWLEFLGYYLADGHSSKNGYRVYIHKYKITVNSFGGHMYPKITACLDRMGWAYIPRDDRIIISSRQLNAFLAPLGHAPEKYIPRQFMNTSARQLKILLESMISCDGTENSSLHYFTSSKQLASDTQEVALKAGWAGNVIPSGTPAQKHHHQKYRVAIIRKKTTPTVNHGHVHQQNGQIEELIDYSGKVYCCTVPNHIMYVRRNGKACWTGNSSRHQSKGIVSAIIPDDEMPRDADGNIFEVIQNPAAVPSRINPGQIAELLAGKIAKKTGVPYRAPLFVDKNDIFRKVNEDAVSHGITDREAVYDADGKPFMQLGKPAQVLTGYQYVLRQKQEAEPYFQARNREDPFDTVSHRPIKGPKVGPLGFYALLAHGADDILRDFSTHGGESNDEYWRAVEMGHAIPSPKTPFALKKLKALLAGAGMQMRKEGDDYRLLPLTDKETLRMSAGVVEAPDQSIRIGKPGKYDLITPFKNGLYGKEVFGGLQGDRWGHIDLVEPLPNPIFEEPIRYVLGLSQAQYNGLVHGSMHLQDGEVVEGSGRLTGGSAFSVLLDRVDVNSEVDKLRKEIPNHIGSAKSKLIRKGRYLSGLQKTKLSPKDAYLISKVPVLPPQFRPVYLTREGAIRVSDFTQLYRDIGMMNNTLQEASGLPSSMRGELRTGLYDALKALQVGSTGHGFGSEERKGILQFLKGPSPSKGHFQDKIFSKRQSVGGRAVIMPNPGLGIDEVGIPEDMAWHTMKSYVMRRLAKQGIKPLDARRMVEDRTRQASDALNAELKHRPILLSRDPKLHKFNVLAFNAQRIPGKSFELPPLVCKGLNADFDGDAMNMYVPGSEAAIDEARKRMLPSRNLFKAGKDNVIMTPEEDTIAGLYFATKFSRPTDNVFASEAKALRAFNNKEVESTDIVTVDGQKRSIAQILINNALPEKLRDYSRVLDNKALMGVLNKVGKRYPNRYVTVVEKLNDLGNDFGYRAALSFSFKDFMSVPSPELKTLDPAMGGLPVDVQEKVTRRLRDSIAPTSMLALLADSGAKGSWNKVQQLKYSPVVTKDFNGIVPHVIQRAYTHGLDLMDWWTASKGNRPALHSKSVEVREPGYFSKQLLRSSLGLTIVPGDETSGEGLAYPVNHPTVVNRYLAQAVKTKTGKVIGRASDPITEDLVSSAKAAGIKEFVVRSPLTSIARKGFYAKDFGRNAGGQKPLVGDDVGIISAHTLSEPAVQLTLKAFHDAGSATADNRIEGLYAIWPLLNGRAPAGHQATLSPYAGKIQSTVKLPTGGWKVMLENGESFNTPTVKKLWFQRGDKITRGEQIHEGYPDPQELLEYKGLRNMQMYLVDQMEKNYGKNAPDRRYLETVVAALTQYGEVKDPGGHQEFMPGDIITLREAEQYNKDLDKGTAPIQVFPTYVGMDQALVKHEPDWAVKMMGRDMIRQLQMSAATGALSSLESPSPIMPYIHGQDFGYNLHRTGEY